MTLDTSEGEPMRHHILALLATSTATQALASDWMTVTTDQSGTKWEIKADSVQFQNNLRTSWVRITPQVPKGKTAYWVAKQVYDCTGERYATTSGIGYSSDGQTITSDSFRTQGLNWETVFPGSNNDVISRFLCSLQEP